MQRTPPSARTTRLIQVTIVTLIGVTQSAATQLSKAAFTHGLSSPYAYTWLSTTLGLLLAMPVWVQGVWRHFRAGGRQYGRARSPLWWDGDIDEFERRAPEGCDALGSVLRDLLMPPEQTAARHTAIMLALFVLYAVANVCYTSALAHEDAALVAAIFGAAPTFVCVLSWFFLPTTEAVAPAVTARDDQEGHGNDDTRRTDEDDTRPHRARREAGGGGGGIGGELLPPEHVPPVAQAFSPLRLRAVELGAAITAAAGIVLASHPWTPGVGTAASPGAAHARPFLAVAAASPVAAALYKVLFARCFPEAGPRRVASVLGQIATINLVLGTTALAIGHAATAGDPSTQAQFFPPDLGAVPFGLVALSCCGSLAFNLAVNYGVTVMPPLYVSVGTVVSTVLNIAYEAATTGTVPPAVEGGGIVLIVLSVLLLVAVGVRRSA
jgi:drug/metabolite transporter (DMT)-like permease